MKYRWGFIESGVFTECKPVVEDDTSLEYTQQSGEVFYRAKLTGSLLFRFEFDDILAKGYNYEHIVVLQYFDTIADDWAECWRGRFTLTDCEIDFDTRNIIVTPETVDRYTKLLDELESEFNLVKLKVPTQPIKINIRPALQMYCCGDTKITNYIGENYWESDCDAVYSKSEITDTYHFAYLGEVFAMAFTIKRTWFGETTLTPIIAYTNSTERDGSNNIYLSASDGETYRCSVWQSGDERRYTLWVGMGANDWVFTAFYNGYELDHIEDNPNISYDINSFSQWSAIYARVLLQTELPQISLLDTVIDTYDVPNNDFTGSVNLNYNKVGPCPTACIRFISSVDCQSNPTEYGQSYTGKYFVRQLVPGYNPLPIAPTQWFICSLWVQPYYRYRDYIDNYAAQRTIKDAYKVSDICQKLFEKTGWSGTITSRAFNGQNDYVGEAFVPAITPKSNVISSYYDTPAQKAPISLRKVLNLLKQAYKAYWNIDSAGNIHIEHISYYDNGYSYSDSEPQLLIDLESHIHTNTKENKCFGQNKVKFEKSDMPETFAFSWMDGQTQPFDGWPILSKDNYIQKGTTEDTAIGDFDTDVDFILSSPDAVSKDGFVLFACPSPDGTPDWTLKIEKITAKDEDGITIGYRIQNADGAFIKIHKSWWRYSLPCENINVNNEDTTALSTGKYKAQSVEFADTVLAEILADIDNCNKVIRTQQGDGKIKTLNINLNSLAAKADLLFNFVGRWYYLKGLALGNSITINLNGESTTIQVSANNFLHKYAEPITALDFNGADVVSVNFADCDRLENLTTADGMFENCAELLAVDFGGKKLAAVTSAVDMFAGCAQLTTLVCPQTSTWKPDLSFADCPDLTLESINSLIGFLYDYDSGVHTIDFNSTMWNALDADTQTDITTRAAAKGWTIGTAVAYYISGQSAASTVYATINGTSVEIPVTAGAFNYSYYAPITNLSFAGDADVTDIDFSLSDGLAGVTSLNDAFKNCAGLTTLDFTNCDLSNVASASDCFAGCVALYTLEIPTGTWKPDVDLSDTVILYSEMLNVVDGLYSYTGGVHNITFNSTIWDAMSVADQQIVFDAADAKGWTTNAVAVVYVIRGTSSAATETFNIQFIQNGLLTPDAAETITVAVDGNGDWSFSYLGKKIYSLYNFAFSNTTILTADFSQADDLDELISIERAFVSSSITSVSFNGKTLANVNTIKECFRASQLASVDFSSATFANLSDMYGVFYGCTALSAINLNAATFSQVTNGHYAFYGCSSLVQLSLPKATFENAANATLQYAFNGCSSLQSISMPLATFEKDTTIQGMCTSCNALQYVYMPSAKFSLVSSFREAFRNCQYLLEVDLSSATFANATSCYATFRDCYRLHTIKLSSATFEKITDSQGTFQSCNALTTIDVPQNSTAISPTAAAATTPMDTHFSPLNYTSMLKIANWVSDLTGQTAHTCTFKSSAWNALSAVEQNNIDSILSGKNWTRAIA